MNNKKLCKRVCKKGELATECFTFAIYFISVFLPFKRNFEFGLDFSASLVGPAKTFKYLYKIYMHFSSLCTVARSASTDPTPVPFYLILIYVSRQMPLWGSRYRSVNVVPLSLKTTLNPDSSFLPLFSLPFFLPFFLWWRLFSLILRDLGQDNQGGRRTKPTKSVQAKVRWGEKWNGSLFIFLPGR